MPSRADRARVLVLLHSNREFDGREFEASYEAFVEKLREDENIEHSFLHLEEFWLEDLSDRGYPKRYDHILFVINDTIDERVATVWRGLTEEQTNGTIGDLCICVEDNVYRSRPTGYGLSISGRVGPKRFYQYTGMMNLQQVTQALYDTWRKSSTRDTDLALTQLRRAYMFGGSRSKPVELVDPVGEAVLDSSDQQSSYDEIRIKAQDLAVTTTGSNRFQTLNNYSLRLVQAMGSSLAQIKVRSHWAQMNALRRRLEAEEIIKTQEDPETPPLPTLIASQLRDLVDALNVFAAHEPRLIELDELRADPSERSSASSMMDAAGSLVQNASEDTNVLSVEASASLTDVQDQASASIGASSERAKQFFVRSARNLAIEIIGRAKTELSTVVKGTRDGAYRMAGAVGGAYLFAMVVKANEAAIRTLISSLGGSQTLNHIVDLIVHSLK